jgi:hypothetical protein
VRVVFLRQEPLAGLGLVALGCGIRAHAMMLQLRVHACEFQNPLQRRSSSKMLSKPVLLRTREQLSGYSCTYYGMATFVYITWQHFTASVGCVLPCPAAADMIGGMLAQNLHCACYRSQWQLVVISSM